jgi:hypothetical protein
MFGGASHKQYQYQTDILEGPFSRHTFVSTETEAVPDMILRPQH